MALGLWHGQRVHPDSEILVTIAVTEASRPCVAIVETVRKPTSILVGDLIDDAIGENTMVWFWCLADREHETKHTSGAQGQ